MKTIHVLLTFTEPVLGTSSNDPEIHSRFIAEKSGDPNKVKEEVAAIEESAQDIIDRTMTVFPKMEDGTPFFWDYQIKGMFKNAAKALNFPGSEYKLAAFKTKIDNQVFIMERRIPMLFEGELGECQRPLRAQTAQGERVALAHSEEAPAGTILQFHIDILNDELEKYVRAWLDYGKYNGLGQWHNSGKGRFTWEELK